MKVNNLFATPIAISQYSKHLEIRDVLVKHCLQIKSKHKSGGNNWVSKTLYNTCNTYDIFKDPLFSDLNKWIHEEVNQFKKILGQSKPIKPTRGWFNIYQQKDFQEYHNHNFDYISVIYYLKADKDAAETVFKSPLVESIHDAEFDKDNLNTWNLFKVSPQEGRLVLFKSSLEHCVESQICDNSRITLAYNYGI